MLLDSYAPGHPDIGSAVHDTASTGSDVSVLLWVVVALLVAFAVFMAWYFKDLHDASKGRPGPR